MSEPPLSRAAGPIALVAGALFAAVHLALFAVIDRSDLAAMSADPTFRAVNIAYAATFPLLMLALFAVYGRQARAAGVSGVVGLGAAILGTMSLGANMWFEAFTAPWLVDVVPQVLTVDKSGIWQVGYLSSYLLFAVGWVLFGLVSLRARVFPIAISIAITVGGAVGFLAAMPPFAIPLGLAIAALGWWLVRTDRAARLQPQPATG